MATLTKPLASFESGAIRAEFEINDANWHISKVRVINNSDHGLGIIVKDAGTPVFSETAPANETTSWNTSGVNVGRQEETWNEIDQRWEPGGIDWGTYTVEAGIV